MKEMKKIVLELKSGDARKKISRYLRTKINPPKESRQFVRPEALKILSERVNVVSTDRQPKQVVFDATLGFAYVTCMEGRALDIFELTGETLSFKEKINFPDQSVEVAVGSKYVFVTTTNFERSPNNLRNRLWVLNKSGQKLSSVDTGGNWSKVIAISPDENELVVSNWHSHDLSIIDISNPIQPNVAGIIKWGESPRNVVYLPDGNHIIVGGFHSGNIGLLRREREKWEVEYTSSPFDHPNYSGNMRHILLFRDGEYALISNMGRNLVLFWNVENRSFEDRIVVGKSPNSMGFVGENFVAVSCRESSHVYFIDLCSKRLVGRSVRTGEQPTGLCAVSENKFLVTSFANDTLELHKLSE